MKGEMWRKKECVKIGGETPCLQHFFMNAQEVLPTARSGSCSRLSRSVVRVAFWVFSHFLVSTHHSFHWMLASTLALLFTLFLLLPVSFHLLFPFCVCQPLDFPLTRSPVPLPCSYFCPSISYFPPTLSSFFLSYSEREGVDVKSRKGSNMHLKKKTRSLSHTLQKWEGLCLCAANKRPVNIFRSACDGWWQQSRLCAEAAVNIGVLILLCLHPVMETSEQTNQPR